MEMKQSLADPCVFYKHNKTGQTVMIAVCFVNDMLLVGTKEEVEWFKKQVVMERFGCTDLGKLQKHLGL
jgi:hypothetical protein